MYNFKITFAHPWLWLLLIPAIGFALFTYFRSPKKYRRTRNKIVSLCLHIMVIVLCTATLVNTQFEYEVNNTQNELLFLIDTSDSNDDSQSAKDEYLYNALAMVDSKSFSVGVVTFGFDQKYTVPITNKVSSVYEAYKASMEDEANKPDSTATDIAAALEYSRALFKNPQTSKIVLISDGYETDENVTSVVRAIAASGTSVDVIGVDRIIPNVDIEVVGVKFPDYNVEKDEEFEIELTFKSLLPDKTDVQLTIGDNDKSKEVTISLTSGLNTVKIPHTVSDTGLHSFKFDVSYLSDEELKNNSLISYMYVEKFDKILVIESYENQSEQIKELFSDYKVTVFGIEDSELPVTADELREYDEVILNNISNSDLKKKKGLDEALQRYVSEYGGAMFTVGGNEQQKDENGKNVSHSYNRSDLKGSILQTMLPVEAVDYTPPLGLYVIIDVSGSMDSDNGGGITKKQAACDTAMSIVKDDSCLSERDYCGIMTLSDDYEAETPKPVSMLNQSELRSAIVRIREGKDGGGTMFGPAINGAAQQLSALKNSHVIEKMHIIVITDGGAGDFTATEESSYKSYKDIATDWAAKGVTISFVGVDANERDVEDMKSVAEACNEIANDTVGKVYNAQVEDLTIQIKGDIKVPSIKEVEEKEFVPTLEPNTNYTRILSQDDMPTLGGFYGTKAKSGTTVLSGDYNVPIYSEWRYGKGMVGSFMCDLQGIWSEKMLADENGQKLIKTIANKLMPTKSIRKPELIVDITEDNYISQVSVISVDKLKDGEKVELTVTRADGKAADVVVTQPSEGNSYTRGVLQIKTPGVYIVTANKYDANGAIVAQKSVYKSFSYSKEYSLPDEDFDAKAFLDQIAEGGEGTSQSIRSADATAVLDGFVTAIKKSYNPTILFMILAIVFFITDVAVRKFKFKWIHEIIREAKEKKQKQKQ